MAENRRNSFAGKVLQAVSDIGGDVTIEQIIDHLCLQTNKEHARLVGALSDLHKVGKVSRVSRGIYTKGPQKTAQTIQASMWAIIRARRSVSIEDLQELTGASAAYAQEYLLMLCRRGVLAKSGKIYRLIKDPGPQTPGNDDNAEKQRRLRLEKKKKALEAIEMARKAVMEIPD